MAEFAFVAECTSKSANGSIDARTGTTHRLTTTVQAYFTLLAIALFHLVADAAGVDAKKRSVMAELAFVAESASECANGLVVHWADVTLRLITAIQTHFALLTLIFAFSLVSDVQLLVAIVHLGAHCALIWMRVSVCIAYWRVDHRTHTEVTTFRYRRTEWLASFRFTFTLGVLNSGMGDA